MKDSVLLNIPDAWAKWDGTAALARRLGKIGLIYKYMPDSGAGWYAIYKAEKRLRKAIGAGKEGK